MRRAVFLAVTFAAVFAVTYALEKESVRSRVIRKVPVRAEQPARWISNAAAIAGSGHVDGDSGARVSITIFSDYQCPGCALLSNSLRRLIASGERIRVVRRHYPLTVHRDARVAALAAECAGAQAKFETMDSLLFAVQDSIGLLPWVSLANRIQVRDPANFTSCMLDYRLIHAVDADREVGEILQLVGTPSYIVGDTLYFGAPPEQVLIRQVRSAQATSK